MSYLLGIDTCGSVGTVALARLDGESLTTLGEATLVSGQVAAGMVAAVRDLLLAHSLTPAQIDGIVVVKGPGSFTGIRIGIATAKAIAQATGCPLVTVSRLALMARLAATPCSALDAYRGQLFVGLYSAPVRELLVTAGEFAALGTLPGAVAFCEESVAQLLETIADVELARTPAPTASEAIRFALPDFLAGHFAEVASLDGYYLRGADAKTQATLAAERQ